MEYIYEIHSTRSMGIDAKHEFESVLLFRVRRFTQTEEITDTL